MTSAAAAPSLFAQAYPFAISLALGALVGVDRERKRLRAPEPPGALPAGIRTFSLIAVLGCALGWVGERHGPIAFAAGLGGFALLIAAVYVMTAIAGDLGATTEVAALLTLLLGAMVYGGEPLLASGIAVAMTVVLSARAPIHDAVLRIEAEDLFAALTLAVVTVIVLPMLPDRGFGPYGVWNPFRIWLLVAFISAIGFVGYLGIKLLGPGRGSALAGLLGGIVSSTAATLSFAGRSREEPAIAGELAVAVALAWAAMFARVLAILAVVGPGLLGAVAVPLGGAALVGAAGAGALALHARRAGAAKPATYRNPFSLASALEFGLVFAALLLLAKAAEVRFHDAGLLVAAGLGGLVDMDATTLSAARLAREGELLDPIAARAILLAAGASVVVKAGIAVAVGTPALRRLLVPVALATLAAGAALALLSR
jgi:uncharacterized membrane protein (DUF4010 family)